MFVSLKLNEVEVFLLLRKETLLLSFNALKLTEGFFFLQIFYTKVQTEGS